MGLIKFVEGYLSQAHLDIANFVFKTLNEGEVSYTDPSKAPNYSGHDVRHVIQSYGWNRECFRLKLIQAQERINQLEKELSSYRGK